MYASDDLDMGEMIMPPAHAPGSAPPKQATLQPWFLSKGSKRPAEAPPECTGQRSNAEGKRPVRASVPAKLPAASAPKVQLTPEEAARRRIDHEHVTTVKRELEAIRGHVLQREEENNASFKQGKYPEWRLVPAPRKPKVAASAAAPTASRPSANDPTASRPSANDPTPPGRTLATGKKLPLHRLLSCDDDEELTKHGAVLVTYHQFIRASNEKVDVSLLGTGKDEYESRHMISSGNRESVSYNYAVQNLEQLITSVPSYNGDHRLTGMQRLATAMITRGYDQPVHLLVKQWHATKCDACYRLPAGVMPSVIINNLTVAAGKTRATIFSTMRHIATPEAFLETQNEYTEHRLRGFLQCGSGIYKAPYVEEALTKLARVIIALVPAPVIQQWVDASEKLASTFGENAWITWSGISPIHSGGGRGKKRTPKVTTQRDMTAAIALTESKKCALFWVMEANTKSSSAALFTAPEYALPYRIIDEGTGAHLTEPRTTKPQSVCRYTVICNATLEQLKDHTSQQPKHPLRRAMDGSNMNLTNPRHCAIATLCSLPSWVRLVTGLSMAPLMPQGILKICMRVDVKSLAGSLNKGSDMVLTSTEDLIKGLILDNSSSMTTQEKEELTNKCRAILNRAEPDVSIADNLQKAIEQVETDEKALLPMPEPLPSSQGRLTDEQRVVADGILRYRRVYGTMKRLFTNLRTALCPDPPPECPITLDAIEPQNVMILSCCTTLIDKESLKHITNKRCPMCRAPITNVASASQAADALQAAAAANKKPEPEPEPAAPSRSAVRPGNTDSLVAAFREAAGTKCQSSLEAVVRTLEVALQFKPKGLRVLLCCNVWGNSRTYNSSNDEEKNTYKTCDFLRRAMPQLTSVCTIGRGPKSKLPQYKAFDDTNRVFIIDTSARSTTMAGLDLPETDIILFDRLGEGGRIDLSKIVQSIGRAMRAQKKSLEEHQADLAYFRKHGRSRHAPKLVVFIDKYKAPSPPPPPGLPELPEGQVYIEAAPPRYGTPPGHTDDEEEELMPDQIQSSSDDDGAP